MTSPTTGHIGVDHKTQCAQFQNDITVPKGHVIMISFPFFKSFRTACNARSIQLTTQDALWDECHHEHTDTYVFHTNNITLQQRAKRTVACFIPCTESSYRTFFNMTFSFHPENAIPQRLSSSGLYNCSVDHYWSFQQHLDCNMKVECEDGRDEGGHCPFSSPACDGWVASRRQCIRYVSKASIRSLNSSETNFYKRAIQYCRSLKAKLGWPRSDDDFEEAYFRNNVLGNMVTYVGVFFGGLSVPSIYRRSMVDEDKTVYHRNMSFRLGGIIGLITNKLTPSFGKTCRAYTLRGLSFEVSCPPRYYNGIEFNAACALTPDSGNKFHNTITVGNISFEMNTTKTTLTRCQSGEITHTFLTCYPHCACEQGCLHPCIFSTNPMKTVVDSDDSPTHGRITSLPVFTCSDGTTSVSYTLVCDFRKDCSDDSDETFCHHPPCEGSFTCTNGQCVSFSTLRSDQSTLLCDTVSDCVDESDEKGCQGLRRDDIHFQNIPSPVLVNFDGLKSFTYVEMDSAESCPDTHYRCPGEYNDCLPVYTRCNGWYDCVDHEDEEGCEQMTCPGFYRCFTSTVCVHADHLCDGWPHCPQRDDEWLCDLTCPAGCLCQGHAFLCPHSFSGADLFPVLRYLDAQGSGMTPSDLEYNPYTVHLRLSHCSLVILPAMHLPNLLFLDVSSNLLESVDMSVFTGLMNLRNLSLAKNPIHLVHSSLSSVVMSALKNVDLSHTKITVFDSKALSNCWYLQTINLSFTTIHSVHNNGFRFTPRLRNLYLEGSPVKVFPADVFKSLSQLRFLTAGTYKLCCSEILPDRFEALTCDAPQDEISSCEDLLQSGTYRGFLWLISILSVLGNVFCFVVRICVQRTVSTSGFHVFVTNLSMSDLLMGVYIAVIGVADVLFRGKYLHYDDTWTHSVACKVAGFLSLLSCEVSALIIWLITLDRFIVLHFPFSRLRFERTSAIVACLITWLAGCLLALVPLLPVTSHWEFYSQTGICIPLPVTRQGFKGRVYSVGILIVLNLVLFLLIATGQAFIYWSVQKNALKTDSTKISRDLTIARRLISVAVTDFLCWFPIGLCGLLAYAGIPISGEVNVALAIFVLPLNSALNPFMYTFNMLMEKRRKSKEALILQWLESHSEVLDEI